MSFVLALLGIPALIKRISKLEERLDKQERELMRLRLLREGDMRVLKDTYEVRRKAGYGTSLKAKES